MNIFIIQVKKEFPPLDGIIFVLVLGRGQRVERCVKGWSYWHRIGSGFQHLVKEIHLKSRSLLLMPAPLPRFTSSAKNVQLRWVYLKTLDVYLATWQPALLCLRGEKVLWQRWCLQQDSLGLKFPYTLWKAIHTTSPHLFLQFNISSWNTEDWPVISY